MTSRDGAVRSGETVTDTLAKTVEEHGRATDTIVNRTRLNSMSARRPRRHDIYSRTRHNVTRYGNQRGSGGGGHSRHSCRQLAGQRTLDRKTTINCCPRGPRATATHLGCRRNGTRNRTPTVYVARRKCN